MRSGEFDWVGNKRARCAPRGSNGESPGPSRGFFGGGGRAASQPTLSQPRADFDLRGQGAVDWALIGDIQDPFFLLRIERTLEFKGLEFLQRFAIPNVFFHVTTAYNILRHNGVELGKRDFLNSGRDW